jgi:hypothetical protein
MQDRSVINGQLPCVGCDRRTAEKGDSPQPLRPWEPLGIIKFKDKLAVHSDAPAPLVSLIFTVIPLATERK